MKFLSTSQPDFPAQFTALLSRAATEPHVAEQVREIIAQVREHGDKAVLAYTNKFDRVEMGPADLRISADEIAVATAEIPHDLRDALALAAARIERFHRAQLPNDIKFTDETGATLGMR